MSVTSLPRLVYIAGPYTNPEPLDNVHRAIVAGDRVVDETEGRWVPVVPHLSMLWQVVRPRPIEFWYDYDLAILARCDALIRLAGESVGADLEVAYALAHDITVLEGVDVFLDWERLRDNYAEFGGKQ